MGTSQDRVPTLGGDMRGLGGRENCGSELRRVEVHEVVAITHYFLRKRRSDQRGGLRLATCGKPVPPSTETRDPDLVSRELFMIG